MPMRRTCQLSGNSPERQAGQGDPRKSGTPAQIMTIRDAGDPTPTSPSLPDRRRPAATPGARRGGRLNRRVGEGGTGVGRCRPGPPPTTRVRSALPAFTVVPLQASRGASTIRPGRNATQCNRHAEDVTNHHMGGRTDAPGPSCGPLRNTAKHRQTRFTKRRWRLGSGGKGCIREAPLAQSASSLPDNAKGETPC